MLMLPSLYRILLDYIEKDKVPELDTVIVAGESCPSKMCSIHFATLPKVKLYNEYGPTEATVWSIAHKVEREDTQGIIPIGVSVANSEIYLLNERLEIVPLGAIGEIYIGGPGVAGKYINRSDLDGMVYIKNPFKKEGVLYKTGDLARYNYLGKLEFHGRSDEQIKIRGFRVELNEIEKTLLLHPNVEDAVVLVESAKSNSYTYPLSEFTDDTPLSDLVLLTKELAKSESEEILESIESLDDEAAALLYDKLIEEN
jgi:non-ribosomal peptide synthetase component F